MYKYQGWSDQMGGKCVFILNNIDLGNCVNYTGDSGHQVYVVLYFYIKQLFKFSTHLKSSKDSGLRCT